jgi:hypothetical protein
VTGRIGSVCGDDRERVRRIGMMVRSGACGLVLSLSRPCVKRQAHGDRPIPIRSRQIVITVTTGPVPPSPVDPTIRASQHANLSAARPPAREQPRPPQRSSARTGHGDASATNRALSPKTVRSARRVPTGGPFLRLQNPPPPGPRAGRHQHQPVAPHHLVSRVRASVPVEAGHGGAAHRPRRLAPLRWREHVPLGILPANGRAALTSSGSLLRPPAASTNPTP